MVLHRFDIRRVQNLFERYLVLSSVLVFCYFLMCCVGSLEPRISFSLSNNLFFKDFYLEKSYSLVSLNLLLYF